MRPFARTAGGGVLSDGFDAVAAMEISHSSGSTIIGSAVDVVM